MPYLTFLPVGTSVSEMAVSNRKQGKRRQKRKSPIALWAKATGKSVRTVRRWARAGKIPSVAHSKIRGHYTVRDLLAFRENLDGERWARTKEGRRVQGQDAFYDVRAALGRLEGKLRLAGKQRFSTMAAAKALGMSRATFYRKGYASICAEMLREIYSHNRQLAARPKFGEPASRVTVVAGGHYDDMRRRQLLSALQDKSVTATQKAEFLAGLDSGDAAWLRKHLKR